MEATMKKVGEKIRICLGHVSVSVPLFDCEGVQRTIDFNRVGKCLYGGHSMHWTCRPYLREARKIARRELKKSESAYPCLS